MPARFGGPRASPVEQGACLVDPIEAEVQRSDALFEVVDRSWVTGDLALDGGQHRLGLLETLTHGVRARQGERGGDVGDVAERELGQLGAQFRVARQIRRMGRADEQLRRDRRAGVEQKPHHAQRVVRSERVALLQRGRHAQPQRAAAERGQPGAQHVAVQRMRKPNLELARAGGDRDQPVRLDFAEHVVGRQRRDLAQPQWLTQREQLDRRPLVGREPGQTLLDELHQRRAHRDRFREPP